MILTREEAIAQLEGVPRVGGGDPSKIQLPIDAIACSPRRRG